MRNEVPAALPLLAVLIATAAAPVAVHPHRTAVLLVALAPAAAWLLRGRKGRPAALVVTIVSAAAALTLSASASAARKDEDAYLDAIDAERFVEIEAPVEHGWSRRGTSHAMRVEKFRVARREFNQPLMIYARFEPPDPGDHGVVRARGLIRRSRPGFTTLSVKSPRLLSFSSELPRYSPRKWNRMLARRLAPLATAYPVEVALVEAVALGRSERLTDDLRTSFRRGGTYHLLVFSGLQIAAAAGALAWLLRWLHAPRASDWLLAAFAALAPLFIGPTASVSRASLGIGLYALSRIAGRPTSLPNLWCVAAIVQLLAEPAALQDPGFHLTYAGAGAMIFIARKNALAAPLAAELSVTPLTLYHFRQYALGGSIVTIAMTPLIFAMLVASAAVFVWPPAIRAITLLHWLCAQLNSAGARTSGTFAAPELWALAVGWFLALLAVAFAREWRSRLVALALAIPLFVVLATAGTQTEVHVLDVGQGDSILVRTAGSAILVDGGGRADWNRFGETVLLPLLADLGVRHLDAVVLTHAHPDHCGGLGAVLQDIEVDELWVTPARLKGECSAQLLDTAREVRTQIRHVRHGDRMALPGMHITAHLAYGHFRRSPENNSSIVLRVQLEAIRVLLTGDIERDAEMRLRNDVKRTDVLKVAHHGSRTSTTEPFLGPAAPRLAVISAGRRNIYGHPHPDVLARLSRNGARVWRTDRSGNLRITFQGRQIRVRPEIDTVHTGPLQ